MSDDKLKDMAQVALGVAGLAQSLLNVQSPEVRQETSNLAEIREIQREQKLNRELFYAERDKRERERRGAEDRRKRK